MRRSRAPSDRLHCSTCPRRRDHPDLLRSGGGSHAGSRVAPAPRATLCAAGAHSSPLCAAGWALLPAARCCCAGGVSGGDPPAARGRACAARGCRSLAVPTASRTVPDRCPGVRPGLARAPGAGAGAVRVPLCCELAPNDTSRAIGCDGAARWWIGGLGAGTTRRQVADRTGGASCRGDRVRRKR
jgi:hypothetical protein